MTSKIFTTEKLLIDFLVFSMDKKLVYQRNFCRKKNIYNITMIAYLRIGGNYISNLFQPNKNDALFGDIYAKEFLGLYMAFQCHLFFPTFR